MAPRRRSLAGARLLLGERVAVEVAVGGTLAMFLRPASCAQVRERWRPSSAPHAGERRRPRKVEGKSPPPFSRVLSWLRVRVSWDFKDSILDILDRFEVVRGSFLRF